MTKRKSHLTLAVDSTKKHPDPEPPAGGAAVKPMMRPNDNMVCYLLTYWVGFYENNRRAGEELIFINRDISQEKKTFTLAHELGVALGLAKVIR